MPVPLQLLLRPRNVALLADTAEGGEQRRWMGAGGQALEGSAVIFYTHCP